MTYTAETLPLARRNFFGGQLPPLNGIAKDEWYPTDEEFALIWAVLSQSSIEGLDEQDFYLWLTENLLSSSYTDQYQRDLTEAMVGEALTTYRRGQ